MSLAEWQTDLAELVVAGAAGGVPERLPSEDPWLRDLVGSDGLRVTCAIQRWWRQQRLVAATPLTHLAAPEPLYDRIAARYLDTVAAHTMFFFVEARRFLEFLIVQPEIESAPHLPALARLEACRLRLASGECGPFRIEFHGDPLAIVAAALQGEALPPVGTPCVVVVESGTVGFRVVEHPESDGAASDQAAEPAVDLAQEPAARRQTQVEVAREREVSGVLAEVHFESGGAPR